jgi:hypothetical protein
VTSRFGVDADLRFTIIPEWVLWHPSLSANAVRLYGTLRRFADGDGVAWPSRRVLADRIAKSLDTVDRCLTELVDAGALRVRSRWDSDGNRTSNVYEIQTAVPYIAEGGSRTDAAPPGHGCGEGSRTDAAGVAAPVRQRTRAIEREPENENVSIVHAPAALHEAIHLVQLHNSLIEKIIQRPQKVTDARVTEMDRLLRLDGATVEEAEKVLRWAMADSFWQSNILSPKSFRKHYKRLLIQSSRQPTMKSNGMNAARDFLNDLKGVL